MKVAQDAVVNRQTVLHIEVGSDELERHLNLAYKKIVQRSSIPGFRKGKAPRAVVERFAGRSHFIGEALDTLVPEITNQSIKDHHLEPSALPRVVIEQREPSIRLSATVPLSPIVELGDYMSIQFDDQPEPVTDEHVNQAMEQIRESQAVWGPVNRGLQLEDMGVVSVTGRVGEKVILTGKDSEYVSKEGSETPMPGFAEALVGMSAGDSKKFTLPVPDHFTDSEIAGKDAELEVELSEVKKKILPPLDDELAASLGEDFESITDLRDRIRENLKARANEVNRRSLEEKTIDALVNGATFELPPLLVEYETEHVLQDQQRGLSANNVSVKAYAERLGKNEAEMLDEARSLAESRLRRNLAMDRVCELEKIEVPEKEILTAVEELKSLRGAEDAGPMDADKVRESVINALRRKHTIERLLEIVQQIGGERRSGLVLPPGASATLEETSDD